jgi:hypothetical protein
MQWREIKGKGGGRGIHVESLVDRYRWTDFFMHARMGSIAAK